MSIFYLVYILLLNSFIMILFISKSRKKNRKIFNTSIFEFKAKKKA